MSAPAQTNMNLGQSVRTILELLILAGVLWLMSSVSDQREATAKFTSEMQAVKENLTDVKSQLNGVPAISQATARIEVKLDEHERRIQHLEEGRK